MLVIMDMPLPPIQALLIELDGYTGTLKVANNDENKSHDVHPTKRRRNTHTTKTGCLFRVLATYRDIDTIWTSVIVNPDHNHDAVASISALSHHRLGAITDEEHQKLA
jgi:hypothetical protein